MVFRRCVLVLHTIILVLTLGFVLPCLTTIRSTSHRVPVCRSPPTLQAAARFSQHRLLWCSFLRTSAAAFLFLFFCVGLTFPPSLVFALACFMILATVLSGSPRIPAFPRPVVWRARVPEIELPACNTVSHYQTDDMIAHALGRNPRSSLSTTGKLRMPSDASIGKVSSRYFQSYHTFVVLCLPRLGNSFRWVVVPRRRC